MDRKTFEGKKNMLVIAMGGSSGMVASALKYFWGDENIKERNINFLLIDTEEYERQEFMYDNILQEEYIYLGGNNPHEYIYSLLSPNADSKKKKEVSECFDIDNHTFRATLPNYTLNLGAGRKRTVGRLLLYMKKDKVSGEIKARIKSMTNIENIQGVSVMLISSCCGGTGSSMFHDIFRLVNSLGNVETYPVVLGPTLFVNLNASLHNDLAEQMKLNAFAFFEELSVYLRFPKVNYSFMIESEKSFSIKNILYFDDRINEETYISSRSGKHKPDKKKFCKEVAQTLSFLFPVKTVTSNNEENGKGTGDELWRLVANMDELLQTGYEYGVLKERKPYISVTHYQDSSVFEQFAGLVEILLEKKHKKGHDNIWDIIKKDIKKEITNRYAFDADALWEENIKPVISKAKVINELVSYDQNTLNLTLIIPVLESSLSLYSANIKGIVNFQHQNIVEDEEIEKNFIQKATNFIKGLINNKEESENDVPIFESNADKNLKAKIDKNVKELEGYLKNIKKVTNELEKELKSITDQDIKPIDFSIQEANKHLADIYLKEKLYSNIFSDNSETFIKELWNYARKTSSQNFKKRTPQEISKSIPAFVKDGVTQKVDYAVFNNDSENGQIKLFGYIALNQRDYKTWTDPGLNYIDNYYSHVLSNNYRFVFFPHIDKRFEPILRAKNTEVSEYLDNRRSVWFAEQYDASKTSAGIEDTTYTDLIAYSVISEYLAWQCSPLTIKHKRGSSTKDDYGYISELKLSLNIEQLLKMINGKELTIADNLNNYTFFIKIDDNCRNDNIELNSILSKIKYSDNQLINFVDGKHSKAEYFTKNNGTFEKQDSIPTDILSEISNQKTAACLNMEYNGSAKRLTTLEKTKVAISNTIKLISTNLHHEVYFNGVSPMNIENAILNKIETDVYSILDDKIKQAYEDYDTKELDFITEKLGNLFKYFGKKPEEFKSNQARKDEIALYYRIQKLMELKVKKIDEVKRDINQKKLGLEGDLDTEFSKD